ncbi:MAG: MBL fold metallo-hydrolase [Nitrospirae bacterium]|nr:MBL fold metallo-hydrolase [Nitrospirota bacterium]
MKEIRDGIYLIDSEAFGHKNLIASYLIKGRASYALIDPGFPSSAKTVMEKLKEKGISPKEIDYLILTHFHIDHSGGVGAFIRENPDIRILVHKRSAYYVKNFAKIVGGARMVFRAELIKQFGEAYPVPAENVHPLVDADEIDLGDRVLKIIHTPGHSPDNICILDWKECALFTGDLSCLQYPDLNRVYIPAGSPPLFELNDEQVSLRMLENIDADEILTPHFGPAGVTIKEFIDRSLSAIEDTREKIKDMFRQQLEFQHMIERLRADIIRASGRAEEDIPEFLRDIYLREMLKTGLMGFLAYMLEYAPYPRGFTVETEEQTVNREHRAFSFY